MRFDKLLILAALLRRNLPAHLCQLPRHFYQRESLATSSSHALASQLNRLVVGVFIIGQELQSTHKAAIRLLNCRELARHRHTAQLSLMQQRHVPKCTGLILEASRIVARQHSKSRIHCFFEAIHVANVWLGDRARVDLATKPAIERTQVGKMRLTRRPQRDHLMQQRHAFAPEHRFLLKSAAHGVKMAQQLSDTVLRLELLHEPQLQHCIARVL